MARQSLRFHTSEKTIQRRARKVLQDAGWLVVRLTQVYPAGMPDLVAFRAGEAVFVECKSSIGKVSQVQQLLHGTLDKQGFRVYVVRDTNTLTHLLKCVR